MDYKLCHSKLLGLSDSDGFILQHLGRLYCYDWGEGIWHRIEEVDGSTFEKLIGRDFPEELLVHIALELEESDDPRVAAVLPILKTRLGLT